jgi:NADH-quinone oxidoreductase subunit A
METPLAAYLLLFTAVGVGFVLVNLLVGQIVRPHKPEEEKGTIYECGEPTIGSAWVQFDLRYYVIALLFVIFDVEVAFFFPWAEVFGKANTVAALPDNPSEKQQAAADQALADMTPAHAAGIAPAADQRKAMRQLSWLALVEIAVFFGVLLVGFAYLWKRGDLTWVRSLATMRAPVEEPKRAPPVQERELVVAGRE